jgi:hypothetical protein
MPNEYPQARQTPTIPGVPKDYQPGWISQILRDIARAIPLGGDNITASRTMKVTDDLCVLGFHPNGGSLTYTLLPAAQCKFIKVWLLQKSTGTVTVTGTVNGAVNPVLGGQYSCLGIWSDGSAFYAISSL